MSEEAEHHEAGPSALANMELCPSWENTKGTHPVAEEGSVLHGIVETGIIPKDFEYTENRQRMVDWVRKQAAPLEQGADEVHKELRLDAMNYFTGRQMNFGTADHICLFLEERHATLTDYKFGFLSVDDPEHNIQGINYAVYVFQNFPEIKSIDVRFLMARYEQVLGPVRLYRKQIDENILRIQAILDSRKVLNPLVLPHTKACMYCNRLGTCATLREKMLPLAKLHGQGYTDFNIKKRTGKVDDPDDLAKLKRLQALMKNYSEAINNHCLKLALEEDILPTGYEKNYRKAHRKFTDSAAAANVLVSEFDVPAHSIFSALELSPAQLETALSAYSEKGKGAKNVRKYLARIAELKLLEDNDDEGSVSLRKSKK